MVDRKAQIERLRKRYKSAPDSKAFAPLADALATDGQVEEALVLLEDGLARHPDYISAMVILGRTLMEAQRLDHSRKVLSRVLDLDGDNFVALGLLAKDAFENQVWHLAEPWLTKLLVLEPHNQIWQELLVKARQQLDQDRSGPGARANDAKVDPDFATMSMVNVYIEQGYYAKALAALNLIQEKDPGRTDVQASLARVEELMGRSGLARPDQGQARRADASPGPRRSREFSQKRQRDKKDFQDWVHGQQPEEGGSP